MRMLDSIFVSNLPAGADAYLGYADGKWATAVELQARFPNSRLLILAVFPADDAEGLDIENGDATIADVRDWFSRQQARKVWRPVLYISAASAGSLLATMAANGFARSSFRLLAAHYGAGKHICGPGACPYPAADGCQWTDSAPGEGGSFVDESLLSPDFFAAVPAPPQPRTPVPLAVLTGGTMFYLAFDADGHAPLSIPPTLPDGVTPVGAVQIASTGPAQVQFAFDGAAAYEAPVSVDWTRGAATVTVPTGGATSGKVQRLDKGANYIAGEWVA